MASVGRAGPGTHLSLLSCGAPGVPEGAGEAVSAGPAAQGGLAKDHPLADLVPGDARQKAFPQPEAGSPSHTGELRLAIVIPFTC